MKPFDKAKIVISDCHLSAGKFYEGKLNPHEDFHFDEDMADLFNFFSTGDYGGDKEVELIIAGDYFDFLNVPVEQDFDDLVTEEVAVKKVKAIIAGHPIVMDALRNFASQPNKKITYLIGNHDADLFFPKVREEIVKAWDPQGVCPSDHVEVVHEQDRLVYEENVEVRHGNQFEIGSELDFDRPFIEGKMGKKYLNMPWGSIYVLKIVNRMRTERQYLNKVRPAKAFIFFGIILDPIFTIRFIFLSLFYFFKTRLSGLRNKRSIFRHAFEVIKRESKLFQDLEEEAKEVLDEKENLQIIIFGHTHYPMNRAYPNGKQYINTGTWTKMINVEWEGIGQQFCKTFALVHIRDGKAECDLQHWVGEHGPHKSFNN